ncbi:MAG: Hpt domain-containing protein [Bacteroidia bacterium]|nr:Hpt domain-containing protein [Bacteroidia bacterium]
MENKTKYIDLSYLKEMTEGNIELIKELVDIFKSQIPEFIAQMDASLNAGDWQALGSVAHKAKASVSLMGMSNLTDVLKTLEMNAKNAEKINELPLYVNKFKETTMLAVKELDELFPIS